MIAGSINGSVDDVTILPPVHSLGVARSVRGLFMNTGADASAGKILHVAP